MTPFDHIDVPYDKSLNDLGWHALKFFQETGTDLSAQSFNNIKPLLRECIQRWLADHPEWEKS